MSVSRATVQVDGAPLTLLPKRAPVGNSGPIRGRTLAVFAVPELPPGLPDTLPATVEPGSRTGVAVVDMVEAEALAVARALGLGEILFWDGRRAQILPVTAG